MSNEPTDRKDDELAPGDDAVIGRALRRSLGVLLLISALVAGVSFLLERKQPVPKTTVTGSDASARRNASLADVPAAGFTDITREAGITFVHHNGAYGTKLCPETMGGGVAFFDFDNDGAPDLLFINSTDWPGHLAAGQKPATHALYHNDGQGRFSDVTAGSGLDVSFYGMGVAIGDCDNDGLDDVFITAVGGNHLFYNEGNGKFKDVTDAGGMGGSKNDWRTCAAGVGYDNDCKLALC